MKTHAVVTFTKDEVQQALVENIQESERWFRSREKITSFGEVTNFVLNEEGAELVFSQPSEVSVIGPADKEQQATH